MSGWGAHPRKEVTLQRRLAALGICESDLEERFLRGGGPGGQKINKTSSCVVLRHRSSGIEVRCGRERSQAMNRFLARRELCDRLEAMRKGEADRRRSEQERIRRQKRRRSRRQQARRLAEKRERSETKAARAWRPEPE